MLGKTIFLESGKTFTFENVSSIVENEHGITFFYTAMSDARRKKATFYRPGMVGHSTYKIEEAS